MQIHLAYVHRFDPVSFKKCDGGRRLGGPHLAVSRYTAPMSWKTHVTVAAIVHESNRFLMVQEHASGRLVINQPAGHLDPGESLVDAVVRETLEETAWRFQPEFLLGVYQFEQPDRQRCYLRFAFCGSVSSHNPGQALDDGIVEALWLSRGQLLNRSHQLRSPMVLQCVDDYLGGKRYPLEMLAHLDGHAGDQRLLAGMR
jgi:8-oxo-dGTP pyrophosphatase MutT (NUDIX family)